MDYFKQKNYVTKTIIIATIYSYKINYKTVTGTENMNKSNIHITSQKHRWKLL